MELETLNFNEICRTCKCISNQMQSIFDGNENPNQSPRIDEMLMACASVLVLFGDGLPSQICKTCVEQLKNAFCFKRQCENIDASLREYEKKIKVEIKEEPNLDFTESLNTVNNILNDQSTFETSNESTAIPPVSPKTETDSIQCMGDKTSLTEPECSKTSTNTETQSSHKRTPAKEMYQCRHCNKPYVRLNHLQKHEQSHSKKGKLHVCKICSKRFTRMEVLKRHLMVHLKKKPLSCSTCNRGFRRIENLQYHLPRCRGDTVYPCDICNKVFNREDSLEVHKSIHGDKQLALRTIDSLDNIADHYYQIDQDADTVYSDHSDHSDVEDCFEPSEEITESIESDNMKEIKEIGLPDEDSKISTGTVDIDNDQANRLEETVENTEVEDRKEDLKVEDLFQMVDSFFGEENVIGMINDGGQDTGDVTDSEYLPEDIAKVKRSRGRPRKPPPKFTCPVCNETFHKISALHKHTRANHESSKVHKCSVCNKEFSKACDLRRHFSSHSIVRPYSCKVCVKSFKRKEYLYQHQKLHVSDSDFKCEICQELFSSADNLTVHKARKHDIGEKIVGEKKYECPLCHKKFTTKNYRDVHMNMHTKQKHYPCKVCHKVFLSKSRLAAHGKFHNEQTKKFLCSECGHSFIRKDYLIIHLRRHKGDKPFKCKFCGKGFPRTTDVTVHERYHTGEKPHVCTTCGKGFGRAYNLTVHMRIHTGEKPYKCTYCNAAFAQGNDLKHHVRRHTGERFHCELCNSKFIAGYLLTQHKRMVHGLNVVSKNKKLKSVSKVKNSGEKVQLLSKVENPDEPLQPLSKVENSDEPLPVTIILPKVEVLEN